MSVYLINTDFEETLSEQTVGLIHEQLQFLPLLYASSTDTLAVSFLPSPDEIASFALQPWRRGEALPKLVLKEELSPFYQKPLHYWGASLPLQKWAKEREMTVFFPDPSILSKVSSKAYSFRYTTLKEAALLFSPQDLLEWDRSFTGKKVIKTCFGYSGKGLHLYSAELNLQHSQKTWEFCEKEWAALRPVIGEPWLEKTIDFSSQWTIEENGAQTLHGITFFTTSPKGAYLSSYAIPERYIPLKMHSWIDEHLLLSQKALKELFQEGYFGPVGFDALLYRNKQGQECLYPIVEINPRETLSKSALLMQKRFFPDLPLHLFSTPSNRGGPNLLPTRSTHGIFPRKWWYANRGLW